MFVISFCCATLLIAYFCTRINKNDMSKKLAVFDLDGTLLNTIADLAAATNHALSALGYPTHKTEAYNFFVGNGINKLFERALPEESHTEQEIRKVRELFIPYYNEHNADLSEPYEGIPELLETLQKQGLRLAVASNKYQEATTFLVKRYFPNVNFISVLGQREGIPTKPHPYIIEEIIRTAGVNREEVVYIGDSCVDMETGRNAGVSTVGVTWGFRPKAELEVYKPAYIAQTAEEVAAFIFSQS